MTGRRPLLPTLIAAVLLLPGTFPLKAQEVKLNASSAGPREMVEATRESIAGAYANAWKTLAKALAENRADLLDSAFLGSARDNFARLIRHQQTSGVRQTYVDRGHSVDVLFYSPEGLSVQLRDRAQLELQVLDGDSIVHREMVTVNYIALLTPTEVTWKVRLLQAVPE
jgi:hypothetical protein